MDALENLVNIYKSDIEKIKIYLKEPDNITITIDGGYDSVSFLDSDINKEILEIVIANWEAKVASLKQVNI